MATLIGPPMEPPNVPLFTGDSEKDVEILISYIQSLVDYLYNYRPTVESP